jgi:MFS family permease
LILLFCLNTQAGLLIIGHAAKFIKPMLASGFILVSAGGALNALGRVGTGKYSDIIGRDRAYILNAAAAAVCMFALPSVIAAKSLFLAFLFCMIACCPPTLSISMAPRTWASTTVWCSSAGVWERSCPSWRGTSET